MIDLVSTLWHRLVTRNAQARVGGDSPRPQTTSTSEPTPETDSGTSARTATGISGSVPRFRLSEEDALNFSAKLLNNWQPSEEVQNVLTEVDGRFLHQTIADGIKDVTSEVYMLGAHSAQQHMASLSQDPNAAHLVAARSGAQLEAALQAIEHYRKHVEAVVTSINHLIQHSEDATQVKGMIMIRDNMLQWHNDLGEFVTKAAEGING